MNRFLEYTIFFVAVALLQVLLFDNLNLTIYVTPMVYVAFFVMLPIDTKPLTMLLLGLLMGIVMDILTGAGGLHSIASMATAFSRQVVINITLGRDASREAVIPSPREFGFGKWMKYASLLVGIHCLVFFMFEAFTFHYIFFTLLRALCSSLATIVVVLFVAAIYPVRRH